MVKIKGLSKAKVLAALYNRANPQGMGFLQYDPSPMTEEEAQKILDNMDPKYGIYFDYLKGRVMKVNLTSDVEFEERLYDRDNGLGAAQRVINRLYKEG